MDKKYVKELNGLMTDATNLMICSNKKCQHTRAEMMKDKKILNDFIKAAFTKDIKEQELLYDNLYKNKAVFANSKCVFEHCKDIYIKLVNNMMKIFKSLPLEAGIKKELLKLISVVNKAINKAKINDPDIITIVKNFTIINTFLMNKVKA